MVIELSKSKRKWVRSSKGPVFGVCEGLARSYNVDPWAIRLGFILSVLVFGLGLIAYLVLGLSLPLENEITQYEQKKIMGVCLRLSQKFNWDLGLVRATSVMLAIHLAVVPVLLTYLGLYFFLPRPTEVMYL